MSTQHCKKCGKTKPVADFTRAGGKAKKERVWKQCNPCNKQKWESGAYDKLKKYHKENADNIVKNDTWQARYDFDVVMSELLAK